MKTIGKIIKEARSKKKISRQKLERLIKIKREFIENLEAGRWEALPEYPVVVGFVKNISSALSLNEKSMMAILRRDYPPKILPINPKPDLSESFKWNPHLTFIAGVALVSILVLGYLLFQYFSFIQSPPLEVTAPQEGEIVTSETITVEGRTDPDATIVVNNQPTLVGEDGKWRAEIEVFEGTEEVKVVARSRSGKETIVSRKIKPELGDK